jgi:thermostable 8-oxoguanine DNA glycosylase
MDVEVAWRICGDLYSDRLPDEVFPESPTAEMFDRELLFCLLGGHGVSFELALSATDVIYGLDPFNSAWSRDDLERRIHSELTQAQFFPRCADGSHRRYRYPRRKAETFVRARDWLAAHTSLPEALTHIEDSQTRRLFLCACPGFGLKTASWFLRNIGLGKGLAIIDVHIARALEISGRAGPLKLPRDYSMAELAFLEWCGDLGAPAAAFDLFLWEWQRGSLVSSDL